MGWSSSWLIPFPEVPMEPIRGVLARGGYTFAMDQTGASVTFGQANGLIEWSIEPVPEMETRIVDLGGVREKADTKERSALPSKTFVLFEAQFDCCTVGGDGRALMQFPQNGSWVTPEVVAPKSMKDRVLYGKTRSYTYGTKATLLREERLIDTKLPADTWIARALERKEELLLLDVMGALHRFDPKTQTASPVDGLAPATDAADGMGAHHSLFEHAGAVWIANESAAIYCLEGGAVVRESLRAIAAPARIEKLAVATDARMWAIGENALFLLEDGQFREVWRSDGRTVTTLDAGMDTAVFATTTARRDAPSQVIIARGTDVKAHDIADPIGTFSSSLTAEGDILWLVGLAGKYLAPAVARIAVPTSPRTCLRCRSNRDDNRDVWDKITTVADTIARELGGWSIGET
jgi:hypothetical protein